MPQPQPLGSPAAGQQVVGGQEGQGGAQRPQQGALSPQRTAADALKGSKEAGRRRVAKGHKGIILASELSMDHLRPVRVLACKRPFRFRLIPATWRSICREGPLTCGHTRTPV